MRRLATLLAAGVLALLPAAIAQDFAWKLPPGVAPPSVPADNPMSEVKVNLGVRLFNDAKLSRDQSMSCASCHWRHAAFAENAATHRGVDNSAGKRNPPPLANAGYAPVLTWANPNATTLERQALDPVFGEHPVEMGMAGLENELLARLASDACYVRLFDEAFPGTSPSLTLPNVFKAIAAFQRTLVSFNSTYDRARRGETPGLDDSALAGERLFTEKNCHSCHAGPQFTDYLHHDIGLEPAERDRGLGEKTGLAEDNNRFRTPTLRNVWVTGPFMHDGSVASITGAIRAHTRSADGQASPVVTEEEAASISLFLETLTDASFLKLGNEPSLMERCNGS